MTGPKSQQKRITLPDPLHWVPDPPHPVERARHLKGSARKTDVRNPALQPDHDRRGQGVRDIDPGLGLQRKERPKRSHVRSHLVTLTDVGDRPAMPNVSVVLPALTIDNFLSEQLQALASQVHVDSWELILVFNSNLKVDSFIEHWKLQFPNLHVIIATAKRRSSYARNVGAAQANGDAILFCDADDLVSDRWIHELSTALRRYDAAGGPLELVSLNEPVSTGWRQTGELPGNNALALASRFLPSAVTANFAVRKNVWVALGGFNEDYSHSVDNEFCWRLQLAGYTLGFAKNAVVSYRYRKGIMQVAEQSFAWGKAHARLYRDFHQSGMPSIYFTRSLLHWFWIVCSMPCALTGRSRAGLWVRRASYRIGRLVGSLQQRVLYI
jgi:GT2 family glycosyltransferase